MPSKKTEAPEGEILVKASEIQEQPLCGHVNRQHYGVDGELTPLSCTLPHGHTGDHSAKAQVLRPQQFAQKNPKLKYMWRDGKEYEVQTEDAFWSDAAGTPVSEIQPDFEGHPNRPAWEAARKLARSTNKLP